MKILGESAPEPRDATPALPARIAGAGLRDSTPSWPVLAGLAITLLYPVLAPPGARAEQLPLWEAGVGGTILYLPDYRGADQGRAWLLPFPYLVYRGEFLKADERRVRGLFFKSERTELDVSVNAQPPVDSSENDARRGMPDLDPVLEFGPALNVSLHRSADRRTEIELRLPVRAAIATDLTHMEFAGWVFQPNVNVDVRDPLGLAGWRGGLLAGPMFSDHRYNKYYYAVDPAFATPARPAYNPGGGYAGTQLIATLSRRFSQYWVGGFARWDTLSHAVFVESPLVKTRQYLAGGVAVAWVLGESKTRVEAPR
ncbi:MAG TPA: MipA/OmpV family protein [Burkholderiales bacterium]|nr:MipA/OmpV family protein [Burkholderiales bacterium]